MKEIGLYERNLNVNVGDFFLSKVLATIESALMNFDSFFLERKKKGFLISNVDKS